MSIEISVLIPVYKAEAYIEKCLRSVLNNTYINLSEIIIANDCTPDNSMKIIQKVISDYPDAQIKIINNEKNLGINITRQKLFNAATGKYIICVDSDDWVEPDYLELIYKESVRTNADITACAFFHEINGSTKIIDFTPNYSQSGVENIKALLTGKMWGTLWNHMTKREVFLQNEIIWYPDIKQGEDCLINFDLFAICKTFATVRKPLYHYVDNKNSLTHEKGRYHVFSLMLEKAKENFIQRNIFDLIKDEYTCTMLNNKYNQLKEKPFSNKIIFNENEIRYLLESDYYGRLTKKVILAKYKRQYIYSFFLNIIFMLKNFK